MPSDRVPWHESENPTTVVRGATWRGFIWVAAVVGACLLVGAIIWGISVATSGVRGAGDVVRQNNGADNRVFAQQHFEDLYAAVTTEDEQLDNADTGRRTHPNDSYYQSTFDGIQQECVRDRNQYNADADKVLLTDWQSKTLPHRMDPTDPKFDCKPSLPTS